MNQFDKGGKRGIDGDRAEKNFERIYKERFGVAPIRATKEENRKLHIDYHMSVKARHATVDVKSWKNEEENVWVEFVSWGNLGWVYGCADFIGFETPDMENFIMVRREDLEKHVCEVCRVNFTKDKTQAMYNLLLRFKEKDGKEWFDCVTMIPRADLYKLPHWMLKS